MKKIIILSFTVIILIFGLSSCTSNRSIDRLRQDYPQYFDLGTFKGLEVYVWETESGEYSCGVLEGTNRNKTNEEISNLAKNCISFSEMKIILSSYGIDNEETTIIHIKNPLTQYEIIDVNSARLKEIFWEDRNVFPLFRANTNSFIRSIRP